MSALYLRRSRTKMVPTLFMSLEDLKTRSGFSVFTVPAERRSVQHRLVQIPTSQLHSSTSVVLPQRQTHHAITAIMRQFIQQGFQVVRMATRCSSRTISETVWPSSATCVDNVSWRGLTSLAEAGRRRKMPNSLFILMAL